MNKNKYGAPITRLVNIHFVLNLFRIHKKENVKYICTDQHKKQDDKIFITNKQKVFFILLTATIQIITLLEQCHHTDIIVPQDKGMKL